LIAGLGLRVLRTYPNPHVRGVGWRLAVPFIVPRRARRQGRRAPCALASWRPSV